VELTPEAAIRSLLAWRAPDRTIEAARALASGSDFRPYMAPVREAAAAMVTRGELEVTSAARWSTWPRRAGR
jgi:hypothetical protein